MDHPVSVIMPVYQEPLKWVVKAIDSILTQTLSSFEMIILIDQPDREELESMIAQYAAKDQRIKVIINDRNIGLPRTLNKGIRLAKGKYIARMDADDIAFPNRLKEQFEYMEENREVSLCGTQVIKIDERDREIGQSDNDSDFELLKRMASHINIVTHPTWMLKIEVFEEVGYYRDMPGEDYDFVLRMIDKGLKITNIDKPLLYYRMRLGSYTHVRSLEQKIGFKYTQQLRRERLKTGKDHLDKHSLLARIEGAKRVYGKKQHKAQALLIKARRKGAAGKRMQKNMLILSSMLASPVQRRYYLDWAKAYMIKQFHPTNNRLVSALQPLSQILHRDKVK